MTMTPEQVQSKFQQAFGLHRAGRIQEALPLYQAILQAQPQHFHTWHVLGIAALDANNPGGAVELIGRAIAIAPQFAEFHNNHGNALSALGRNDEAIAGYDRAIALRADYADAYYNRGNALYALERFDAAIASYDRAIALRPDYAGAYNNRGLALSRLGRPEAALASYDRAISVNPDFAEAFCNRGNVYRSLRQFEAALRDFDAAIALQPALAEPYLNRGAVLLLGDFDDVESALSSFDRAIELIPGLPEAWLGRGESFKKLERLDEALECFDRAIVLRPGFAEALAGRGEVLRLLHRWQESLASCGEAIAGNPALAEGYVARGDLFKDLHRNAEALADYDRAISLKEDLAGAYYRRGDLLSSMSRHEAAAESYDRAYALDPGQDNLLGLRLHAKMQLCDWRDFDRDLGQLVARLEGGVAATPPLPVQALVDSPRLQRRAAEIWVREQCPPDHTLSPMLSYGRHDRIRVGYFSADFRNHAVAFLTAELFERHDRAKFEVTALSFGPSTLDEMQQRLMRTFDRFVDVRGYSDRAIAQLARQLELDIAVDLGGFTAESRPRIFALRAAPLQVSYIGYLGTMSAPYMDYLIADPVIVPPGARHGYSEKIIYLPSYQANGQRLVADRQFSREELGLPPGGFVYCCFNASYKILPATFAGWMRILRRVPDSVLWLYSGVERSKHNLRSAAAGLGVDPRRLVFGGQLPVPDYLARYRVADLFLDTLPYNAGATASDALWACLPVLTCAGDAFPSRVGASLLTAIGMPELIAPSQERYEELAVELANDPLRLAALKQRLSDNGSRTALFDIEGFTRRLEAAYGEIYRRHMAGLPPEDCR